MVTNTIAVLIQLHMSPGVWLQQIPDSWVPAWFCTKSTGIKEMENMVNCG